MEQQPEAHNNESLFKIIDFSQSRVIELVLHQVVWGFCVSFYLQEDLSCSTRQLYNLSFFVFFSCQQSRSKFCCLFHSIWPKIRLKNSSTNLSHKSSCVLPRMQIFKDQWYKFVSQVIMHTPTDEASLEGTVYKFVSRVIMRTSMNEANYEKST